MALQVQLVFAVLVSHIEVMAGIPAALLPIHLPTHTHGKAVGDDANP